MGSWSAAGVVDQSITVLQGLRNAVGNNAQILYAKGANVSNDPGITDFLNLYEKAVNVDTRSPQAMIDEAVATAKNQMLSSPSWVKLRVWRTKHRAVAISPSHRANAI